MIEIIGKQKNLSKRLKEVSEWKGKIIECANGDLYLVVKKNYEEYHLISFSNNEEFLFETKEFACYDSDAILEEFNSGELVNFYNEEEYKISIEL